MTAKEQKFLALFAETARIELPRDGEGFIRIMRELLAFDVQKAILVWEYHLAAHSASLAGDKALASLLADGVRAEFGKSAGRLARAVTDSRAVREAVYRFGPTSLSSAETAAVAAQLMLAGKAESDDVLKNAMKNPFGEFGAFMSAVTDRLIIELSRKNPSGASFPKKLAAQVLSYSEKIRGAERAFIAQRIREL